MSSVANLNSWGESASLAMIGEPSSDGFTIKTLYEVDVLQWPASLPIFFIFQLFWIYFFLLTLVFVLQSLSLHFPSCCCFSFHWLSIKFTTGCPVLSHSLLLFSCLLAWFLWSFSAYWHGLCDFLLENFVTGFRLELMYILPIENIRLSLTHLHGFELLVLLPYFIEIISSFIPNE